MQDLKELKATIADSLTEEQIKDILAKEHGYSRLYLKYLDKGREVSELAYSVLEKDPKNRCQYPHIGALIPDGRTVDRYGKCEERDCLVELSCGAGFSTKYLSTLTPEELFELWKASLGTLLPDMDEPLPEE